MWRFPFDDEIYTMVPPAAGWELIRFYLHGGDIHPPLTFLIDSSLYDAGIGEAGLRLISMAMSALALALWQLLALAMVAGGGAAPVSMAARLAAVLLYGLAPLAIGQGDAIRWYPQFAACVALFAALYLAGRDRTAQLAAAMPLGLATSINLIAPLVIAPFALYRYALERRWRWSFDPGFWAIFALFAAPGFYSAVFIAGRQFAVLRGQQFGAPPIVAAATDLLGFFGGNAVGVGHAWLLLPVVAIAAVAVVTLIDRRRRAAPVHFCLVLLAMLPATALIGFDESRSFLYLAPVMAAVLTVFLAGRATVLVAFAVLPGLVAIGDLQPSGHPFKRNAAIPYGELLDFIDRNKDRETLVLSTDPIVLWELQRRGDAGLCAGYFLAETACLAPNRRFGAVFVVSGYNSRSGNPRAMQQFATGVAAATAGRAKLAELHVGHDEDAMLKTRLTGVPLDEFILTVDLYR